MGAERAAVRDREGRAAARRVVVRIRDMVGGWKGDEHVVDKCR